MIATTGRDPEKAFVRITGLLEASGEASGALEDRGSAWASRFSKELGEKLQVRDFECHAAGCVAHIQADKPSSMATLSEEISQSDAFGSWEGPQMALTPPANSGDSIVWVLLEQ